MPTSSAPSQLPWMPAGLIAVRRAGGVTVVQDPADAKFSDMPQNALAVPGSAFSGDDADVLRRSIREAGGQFKKNMLNVVVLAPLLRTPVWMNRDQLVKAVIGEWAMSLPVSLDPAVPVPEAMMVFLQRGKLAQLHEDGTRAHLTRISGVACIEEEAMLGNEGVVLRHFAHVVHSPFAAKRLSPSMYADHPQLILHAGTMVWTDAPAG